MTRVVIVGRGCTKPFAQRDKLPWHDHYYWMHDVEKKAPVDEWRSVPIRRISAVTVRAVFVVRKTDHRGRGLLDLFCGSGGNATATFIVAK